MAFVKVRVPRTSQPQDACGIDWSNPLAPKSGVWVPERNIVTGKSLSFAGTGGAPTRKVTQGGVSLYTNGQYAQTDLPTTAFSVLTWCAVITPDAAPSGMVYTQFFQTNQSTLNWDHFNPGYQGSFTLANNNTYPTCKFVNGFTAGQRVVLHGTYDGTTVRVYRNGVLENSVATANGLSGVTPVAMQFLGGVGGTASWAGSCEYMSWDTTKAMSAAQIKAHADNLGQIFEPEEQWIWVPDAVGAGGTTIAGIIGDAAAAGIAASIITTVTVNGVVGNASATGVAAAIVTRLAGIPGNATAQGTLAVLTKTVVTITGSASAAGVTATITNSGNVRISGVVGAASAHGVAADVRRSIIASVGAALADGATAALLRVIAAGPGNAAAAGLTAVISHAESIATVVGNAIAAGILANIGITVAKVPAGHGYARTVVGTKRATQPYLLTFDFVSQLEVGDFILSCSFDVSVYSGVAGLNLNGPAAIAGTKVRQYLAGGDVGSTYKLRATARTPQNKTAMLTTLVMVLD